MANIKSRRALSDLFKKGTEIRFGPNPETGEAEGLVGPTENDKGDRREEFVDEQGQRVPPRDDQIVMFVMPADPVQREMAMREANAKRALSIVRAKREKGSEEHLTIMAFLADMSDETLVDYVLLGDTGMRQAQAEREVLATDEWKEIDAYQDAMRRFDEMDQEEIAQHQEEFDAMLDLDQKYVDQINARELELREAQRDVLRMTVANSRERVEQMALDKRAELGATQAFMMEYERQMMYYSVREFDDNSEQFFADPKELARQPDLVRDTITRALLPYISDAGEAKNSSRAPAGSVPSVQPTKPATSESSTPVVQNA